MNLRFLTAMLLALAINSMTANAQKASYPPLPSSIRADTNVAQSNASMASNWKNGHKSRVRIISGDTNFPKNGSSYAGVQMQMAKGWKTYWRSPGDTGVPPHFDWSGSRNLKEISIQWPAPQKIQRCLFHQHRLQA